MNDQYITNVKDVLDKADYVTPPSKKVPFCVGKYYDDTGEKICKNIPDIFFVRAAPQFNPGFYKGVLWLDVYFPDTQPKLGSEYMIDFGSEPIDFAELFIQYGDEWKMYGRTGRMLERRQMTNPSWRLSIPLNEAILQKEAVHHVRIKMMAHISSPVNISIVPRRNYDFQTSWFFIVCYLSGGLFIISILFVFFYGLLFKDQVYCLLSGCGLFLFLTEIELKGTGPVYVWNFLAPLSHSPRLMYIFAELTLASLAITFFCFAHESKRKVLGEELVAVILGFCTLGLITTFTLDSPVIVYFCFVIGLLISCVLFFILLEMNKVARRKDIILLFTNWETMSLFVFIRQSFHILRIYNSWKIFTLLDNEYYVSFYFMFLLIIMPAIYVTGRRFRRKFMLMGSRLSAAVRQTSQLHEDEHLYSQITLELLNEQTVLLNTMQLPFTGDSADEKEVRSLVLRTASRSLAILNTVCIFEQGYVSEERPILLLDFFTSCMNSVEANFKRRGNTFSVTTVVPNGCIIIANERILELLISDFLSICVKKTPRDSNLSILFEIDNGKLTYSIESAISDGIEIEPDDKTIGFTLVQRAAKLYKGSMTSVTHGDKIIRSLVLFAMQTKKNGNDTPALLSSAQTPHDDLVSEEKITISDSLLSINGNTPIILLVENSKENTELITHTLAKHCIILKSMTGTDAWNLLNSSDARSTLPDLIITEYNLPLLNGSELFRKCSQEPLLQDIPFIFLASVTEYGKRAELISKGAVDCLLKPFSISELFSRIYSVLNIQNMTHHAVVSKITKMVQVKPVDPIEQMPSVQTTAAPVDKEAAVEIKTIVLTTTQHAIFSAAELSSREQQIALLISEGKSDKQIAEELFISAATVATHNKKLFKKLGVHSRVELMNKVR